MLESFVPRKKSLKHIMREAELIAKRKSEIKNPIALKKQLKKDRIGTIGKVHRTDW